LPGTDSFPWSAALLKTPQKPTRQLSTIHDEDMDLFPGAANHAEWQYADADEASLSSNLDSGLGMSYKSSKSFHSMHSTTSTFVGSLPISFSRPTTKFSSPYGANFSKSWSDLWDEEEELQEAPTFERTGMDIDRETPSKPSTPHLPAIQDEERESATPRQGLAIIDANVRSATPSTVVEDNVEKALPKTKSSSILDKWAALGNFRRARQEAAPVITAAVATPPKTKYSDAFANFTPFGSNKKTKTQVKPPRERAPSWRQPSPPRPRANSSNNGRVWQDDQNWRDHKHSPPPMPTQPMAMPMQRPRGVQPRKIEGNFLDDDFQDEDVEWIGNFRLEI
jgi:hypothetical protein